MQLQQIIRIIHVLAFVCHFCFPFAVYLLWNSGDNDDVSLIEMKVECIQKLFFFISTWAQNTLFKETLWF